jgi:hypothetical protein
MNDANVRRHSCSPIAFRPARFHARCARRSTVFGANATSPVSVRTPAPRRQRCCAARAGVRRVPTRSVRRGCRPWSSARSCPQADPRRRRRLTLPCGLRLHHSALPVHAIAQRPHIRVARLRLTEARHGQRVDEPHGRLADIRRGLPALPPWRSGRRRTRGGSCRRPRRAPRPAPRPPAPVPVPYMSERAASSVSSMVSAPMGALFQAASEQRYLAGWMAYEATNHGLAERYLIQSLRLAQESG